MLDLELMEKEVLALLTKHANDDFAKENLAPLIARTSIEMGHLYSDLGLPSREEMGKLMSANFSSLAKLKPSDVRWKKYLYDCIAKTAPACAKCTDISNCFHCSLAS
ncbi:MAG: nitrogen fixation protein NifQ [Arcobacter sp.]|uniref:nitrogen fixation protein NifQ n=1 Tax=Arcobacter sp. TaxID=1872629 RepID=UPI003B003143